MHKTLLESAMDVPGEMPDVEAVDQALLYAVSVVGRWVKNGRVYIPEIDPDIAEIAKLFEPIYEARGSRKDPKFVGYAFSALSTAEWAEHFFSSVGAADLVRERIYLNTVFGQPLPRGVMPLVGAIIGKKIDDPRKEARKPKLIHRDTLLAGVAKRVSGIYGIRLGASSATYVKSKKPPIRGCTIAAAALTALGIPVNPRSADNIVRKSNLPIDAATRLGVFDEIVAMRGEALGEVSSQHFIAAQNEFIERMDRARNYFS